MQVWLIFDTVLQVWLIFSITPSLTSWVETEMLMDNENKEAIFCGETVFDNPWVEVSL